MMTWDFAKLCLQKVKLLLFLVSCYQALQFLMMNTHGIVMTIHCLFFFSGSIYLFQSHFALVKLDCLLILKSHRNPNFLLCLRLMFPFVWNGFLCSLVLYPARTLFISQHKCQLLWEVISVSNHSLLWNTTFRIFWNRLLNKKYTNIRFQDVGLKWSWNFTIFPRANELLRP